MKIGIIGCGIGGPAAAILLRRAGHEVDLIERSAILGPAGAGILLQPLGLEVLDKMGCGNRARQAGVKIERLQAFRPGGQSIFELSYDVIPDGKRALGIHRGALFSILMEQVRELEISVTTSCEITSINEKEPGSVCLTGTNIPYGESTYDLIVVADGAQARIDLKRCGLPRSRPEPQAWGAWWISLPDPDRCFPDTLHQIFDGPSRLMGVLPTGSPDGSNLPHVSLFWGIRLQEAADWKDRGLEVCKSEMLELEPRLKSIFQHWDENVTMTLARYYDRFPRKWHQGRVVLLGDAAHAMSPHLGQGANLALQDVEALVQELAAHTKRPIHQCLVDFESRRRPHAWWYLWFSRIMSPFFQSNHSCLATGRDILMPCIIKIPFLLRRMVRVLRGEIKGWKDFM